MVLNKKRSFFWNNKVIDKTNDCSSKRQFNFFSKICKKMFNSTKQSFESNPSSTKQGYAGITNPNLIVPLSTNEDINEWKTDLLKELEATRYNCDVNSHDSRHHDYESHDPDMTLTQPSELLSTNQPKKHDYIKEKLDMAAARRNEIKNNRLREQMDTALFETMRMLRQEQYARHQNLESLFSTDKHKKYSNSMSSEHGLPINQMDNHRRQQWNEENHKLIW